MDVESKPSPSTDEVKDACPKQSHDDEWQTVPSKNKSRSNNASMKPPQPLVPAPGSSNASGSSNSSLSMPIYTSLAKSLSKKQHKRQKRPSDGRHGEFLCLQYSRS